MATVSPESSNSKNPKIFSIDSNEKANIPIEDGSSSEGSPRFLGFLFCFIVIYCLCGARIFQMLEQKPDEERLRKLHDTLSTKRQNFTENFQKLNKDGNLNDIWNQTLEAFDNYESEIDSLVDGTLKSFMEREAPPSLWKSYTQALSFVLALTTTIGYGNLTPRTSFGKIYCVVYSLIGIPVMFIFIANVGKLLAKAATSFYLRLFGSNSCWRYFVKKDASKVTKMMGTSASMLTVALGVFSYMSIGAFFYNATESWGFINSFYFVFLTMTTIGFGFGDLVPEVTTSFSFLALLRIIYVVWGFVITSTAIALAQNHYTTVWMEEFTRHSAEDADDCRKKHKIKRKRKVIRAKVPEFSVKKQ